jgi:putative ABC transport system permease protein
MIKSYFRVAWRNLLKDRQFTILNLLGLSTGLTCVFLICLWVFDEQRMDKFHEKDNQLFQVMERQALNDGISGNHQTSGLTAEELKEQMPEVEYATAVLHYSWFPEFQLSATEDKKIKAVGQFADKDYFNIFSFGLIQGNKDNVLAGKNSIVLSESLANNLFNTAKDIIGKVVNWELGGLKRQVIVSGVFEDIPVHSSEQFDFLLTFNEFKEISPSVLEWGNNGTNAYVILKEGQDVARFNTKISNLVQKKLPGSNREIFLTKFSNNYLFGTYENGVQSGGRIEYVRLFTVVAIFILLIAAINFMNLSTAKATRRLKDVGVRKVIGATRGHLILQYMGESVLLAFVSLSVSLVLIWLLLPHFNSITGKSLSIEWNSGIATAVLGITLLTGLLSGSYPALYLSGFKPVSILKGKLKTSLSELWIRKGLVVLQFTLSVLFIVSVLVIYKQVQLI